MQGSERPDLSFREDVEDAEQAATTKSEQRFFRYVRAMMEMKLQECSRSLLPAGRSCGVVSRRHL